ncbi:outer membrane protein assembly factor BamE [Sphingomonas prati]|uniref:Outer membrane protein assembly factor BamE (Lipoprotein component of BamABCDE complex) n=1 Tax=Sphingomonas prati TaxID=1843237 RepID=A0A7W9BTY0_9SPHN|nr:outer membrane protein assembly factor BamE [Sphingomonas prati]MBB5729971.1 outer membrane protein assembly factor BamE (lipoprotein component of BamABCDE complex) [Sphingomonas prati]GGE88094.1 outer membrane protein assembly factor BamE [Sphingomonas prati]
MTASTSRFGPRYSGFAAVALAALVLTTGCARIRDHKGYVPDNALIATVQPGVDNRMSVERTLGRPSFVGQFDPNVWYYLSRNTSQLAFGKPKPTDQMLLTVRFDAAGNVVSARRSGMDQIASISPSSDKTPTLGRHTSFFSELFGNIGSVGGATGQAGTTADNPTGN